MGAKAKLMVFFGGLALLAATISLVNDLRVYSWHQVEATIVHYEQRCCMARGEPDTVYVQYQYQLAGETYVSDQVAIRAREVRKNGEKEYTLTDYRRFKLGQNVHAYMSDDGDDREVVLERRVSEQAIWLFATGVFFILFGRLVIKNK